MRSSWFLFLLPIVPLELESARSVEQILLEIKEAGESTNQRAVNPLLSTTVDGETFCIYYGVGLVDQYSVIRGNIKTLATATKISATLKLSAGLLICNYGCLFMGVLCPIYCLFTHSFSNLYVVPFIWLMLIYSQHHYIHQPIQLLKKLTYSK